MFTPVGLNILNGLVKMKCNYCYENLSDKEIAFCKSSYARNNELGWEPICYSCQQRLARTLKEKSGLVK